MVALSNFETSDGIIRLPAQCRLCRRRHKRHTAAMNLLQSGVDLTTIKSWLGHASVNTTHQYVEADLEMKRRALEKCKIAEVELAPYRPTDKVLALLEAL